jgi:hypothetical protein
MDFQKEADNIKGKKPEDTARKTLLVLLSDIQSLSKKLERIKDAEKLEEFLNKCLTSSNKPAVFQTALDVGEQAIEAVKAVSDAKEAVVKAEERKAKKEAKAAEAKRAEKEVKEVKKDKKKEEKKVEPRESTGQSVVNVIVHVGGGHTGEQTIPVRPLLGLSKKPKKTRNKATIPSALRSQVWNTYFGVEVGQTKCYCCRINDVSQRNFEAGHVLPEAKGGPTTIENLRPICGLCNRSMGSQHMADYCKKHYRPELDK